YICSVAVYAVSSTLSLPSSGHPFQKRNSCLVQAGPWQMYGSRPQPSTPTVGALTQISRKGAPDLRKKHGGAVMPIGLDHCREQLDSFTDHEDAACNAK